jgi:tetratricopeptide (TPR) repeat protein/DNA polymerase III delta prime subunit
MAPPIIEAALKRSSPEYFTLYEKLTAWSSAQWQDHNDIFEQVRHDDSHTGAMLDFAGVLLQPRQKGGNPLLDAGELFLLAAAIRLHDIGMQYGWKQHLDVAGSRGQLSPAERLTIRRQHAATSGKVIRSFATELPGSLHHALSQQERNLLRDLLEPLAFIAESHTQPALAMHLAREIGVRFPGSPLKIALLAALVQFCDVLHMDRGRLNLVLFHDALARKEQGQALEADYSDEDWRRYFQSYHVKTVQLSPLSDFTNTFRIDVSVVFHPEEPADIRDRFIEVYRKRLTRRKNDCVEVLKQWMRFDVDDPFRRVETDSNTCRLPAFFHHLFPGNGTHTPPAGGPTVVAPPRPGPVSLLSPYFLGREATLAAIKKLLLMARGKCLTLRGEPGVGKTEVAHALLQELAPQYPDGCWFISFEGVRTQEHLLARLVQEVNGRDQGTETILCSFLDGKRCLLVLDNMEDPLADDKPAVLDFFQRLLPHARESLVLLTSRETLGIPLEIIHKIEPLAHPQALELLLNVAEAQGFRGELSPEEGKALLDELGGLPLAIVLAAPALRFGAVELLAALQAQGIAPLCIPGTEAGQARRHQSLEKSFSLSHALLRGTDAERLFLLFALFPAGLTQQDASHLLPETTRHNFVLLESRSLIFPGGEGRFHMLPPLRAYALEQLRQGGTLAALVDAWLPLCIEKSKAYEASTDGRATIPSQLLLRDLPNLLWCFVLCRRQQCGGADALRTLLWSIWWFLLFRGMHREMNQLIEALFEIGERERSQQTIADCHRFKGDLSLRTDRLVEAESCYQRALPIYEQIEDKLGEANTQKALGDLCLRTDRLEEAEACYQRALPIYAQIEAKLGEANTQKALGDLCLRTDRLEEAEACYQRALPIYAQIEAKLGEANTLRALGDLSLRRSRLVEGEACYQRALPIYEQIEDKLGEANTLRALGDLYRRRSRLVEGEACYQRALPIYEQIEDKLGEANTLQALGNLLLSQGKSTAAYNRFLQVLTLREALHDRLGIGGDHGYLARAAAAAGLPDRALVHGALALNILGQVEDRFGQTLALYDLAQVLAGREDASWLGVMVLGWEIAAATKLPSAEKFARILREAAPERALELPLADELRDEARQLLQEAVSQARQRLEERGEQELGPLPESLG